jgi:hypothetical protein
MPGGLARALKDLLPYQKPRLTTTMVRGDKDYPLFDLSGLSDSELAFLAGPYSKPNK